jgi:hypothetical protein
MPDSMGKRQRRDVKARKAAAIEERRLARRQRAADRAAGVIPPGPGLGEPPEPLIGPGDDEREQDEG